MLNNYKSKKRKVYGSTSCNDQYNTIPFLASFFKILYFNF